MVRRPGWGLGLAAGEFGAAGSAGVLLAALIVSAVVSTMAAQDQAATTIPGAGEGEVEVTDTTVPGRWVEGTWVEGSAQSEGLEATDITQPPPAEPEPEESAAAQQAEQTRPAPTVTTVPVATTRPYYLTRSYHLRRIHHPTWDDRLPGTWEGLPATECATATFKHKMRYDRPSWDHSLRTEGVASNMEADVMELAFADPSYEVEPGRAGYNKLLHTMERIGPGQGYVSYEEFEGEYYEQLRRGLTDLGVSSAHDIRDMGEEAANVRWYAWWVKGFIIDFGGDPNHPSCASMLEAANSILTPYTRSVTSTTVAS